MDHPGLLRCLGVEPCRHSAIHLLQDHEEEEVTPEACDDRVSRGGRPIPGYSFAVDGKKVCDEEIKEFIYEAIEGDGYAYGYKKLTAELRDVRSLVINQKKVYRLCKEMNILAPSARGQEEAS